MSKISQLLQLTSLADAAFEAQRAKLARLHEREATIRETLRELDQARSARSLSPHNLDEPAVVAGADLRWHRWIDQRRIILNTELSQVLALKSRMMLQVQNLFGRQQALEGLKSKALSKQQETLQKRSDQTS